VDRIVPPLTGIEKPMTHSQQDVQAGTTTSSPTAEYDLLEVAEAMRLLSQRMADDAARPLEDLVTVAVDTVGGARWASVTVLRDNQFSTAASIGEEAVQADKLQYELGAGPCVDAVLQDSTYVTGDVGAEPRWSQWGHRASTEVGVNSVLSQRLHVHEHVGVVAGLNIYSDAMNAFDKASVGVALVLATHAAVVLSEQLATNRSNNLMKALQSNREIGVAMGILMQQHRFTRQQAFDVLRVASQNSNRKLADIASDVADTGTLTIPRQGR
jgi:ANTAR domain/GAF domain